ncbi:MULTISPECIES: superoxide dismutase family protein [Bizionia]|uniref:Superoxide dismutase [Cu-Zn] n=1 Tax=Bizionia algoritergicola TaxID=291187 RepID=A0A5D0QRF4_9FLAO|nr:MULTISPECIES: superoxide dismutase family protein [Bizionia]OBX22563.1 superoxide dismutase [Bizionia sp. APA-3]TYB70754.1 superoxide dismutase family protein [Bizionia algoritergicola]
MKKLSLLALVVTLAFATSCKNDKKENTEMENTETEVVTETMAEENVVVAKKVTAELNAKSGSNVTGNVVFNEENGTVTMTALVSGLEPGTHAIHLHETADCSSDDGTSSGGHWNPTGEPHGKWGDAAGYHKGDIGNLEADEKGNATITLSTDEWCIGCGDPAKDILGKAVIVHKGVDDFKTQPTGDAGARVSCAGIIE